MLSVETFPFPPVNLLVDKITASLDGREVFVGVSLDFRKAFDTIDFSILLNKLYKYGIRGNAYKWFNDYLTNRKQIVELCNTKSSPLQVQCGVPQGSILGPILFILYINDLQYSSNLLPIIFADDTNLFLSSKNIRDCIQSINTELFKISDWIISNRLSLNIDKTNFIVFSKTKTPDNMPPVSINGQQIKQVNAVKFLGVIIDDKLSWCDHLNYVKGKISRSIGMLACARHNLNRDTLIKLYYAFIYPYLKYCIDVWGHCGQLHFQSLFRLQKRAVRTITFSKRRTPSAPLFKSLGILNLESIYIMSISVFMYKHYYRLLPTVVDEFFQLNTSIHDINTRQRNQLHVPRGRLIIRQQSIRFRGVQIWNQLYNTLDINNLTFNQFKRSMEQKLINGSLSIRLAPLQ